MGNFLYVIAVLLIIGWAVGYFGFHAGGLIHTLLVLGLAVLVIKFVQGKKVV